MVSSASLHLFDDADTILESHLTNDLNMVYVDAYNNIEYRHFKDLIANLCVLHVLQWISHVPLSVTKKISRPEI